MTYGEKILAEADRINAEAEKVKGIYEAGAKSEYDLFWDTFQANGTRKNYNYAFHTNGWNDANFRPKYDIVPTSCQYAFDSCAVTDMAKIMRECGVRFDFSKATSGLNAFRNAKVTTLPEMDISTLTDVRGMFSGTYSLHTIEKLIVSEKTGSYTGVNDAYVAFTYANALKNIVFEGEWAVHLDMRYCPLSKESIISAINVLSSTATSKTVTLKKTAVNSAFETAEGLKDGSASQEWADLIATKSNWTISLV